MGFLYFLEKIRVPILNEFMLLITKFGEETAFLVTALVVFWCVNKVTGYYILSVGFVGTISNQFMKLWFRIPRPWVLDPGFTILEQAREAATGYSFPSGHSQSAVGTFGTLAVSVKNRWVRISALLIALLVPISRMYIGVHTPADVCVAAMIAVALICVFYPFFSKDRMRGFTVLLGVMVLISVAYLLFVELYKFPADIDQHNLASGTESAYTFIGALIGLVFAYIVDRKVLNFKTKATWWAQILKVALGLCLVLAIKIGMKAPLNFLFGELIGRSVRYFLIVIFAGCVWPITFKWFAKLGKKELEDK